MASGLRAQAARGRRASRVRRGDTIVEALVALLLLSVGALALVGLTVTLSREERRAALRRHASERLEVRLLDWSAAPCADDAGATTSDGLAEGWSSHRGADSMLVLVDSVRAEHEPTAVRASLVAARGCDP